MPVERVSAQRQHHVSMGLTLPVFACNAAVPGGGRHDKGGEICKRGGGVRAVLCVSLACREGSMYEHG